MNRLREFYPWIGWVLVFLIFWIKSMYFPIHDFANYYFSGIFFKEGVFDVSMYFPEIFNLTVKEYSGQNYFLSYAPNTPFLPFLFVPFSWFSVEDAKKVFSMVSAILFFISIRRFTVHFEISKTYIWLFPLFFLTPIYNTLLFGQMYFLLLFLLSEGLMAYDKDKLWLMSIFWGLAIMLKVFPVVVVGFLVVQKSYRAIVYLGLSILVLLGVSVGISGLELWTFYWNEVLPRFNAGEIAGAYVDNYQSVLMFLKRLLVYDEIYNEGAIWHSPIVFKMLLWGAKSFLFLITLLLTSRVSGLIFRFAIWMLFSMIISAYGSTYGLLILAFLFFAISQLDIDYRFKFGLGVLIFIVLNNSVIQSFSFPWNYMRMYGWIGILGILIWNYRNSLSLRWVFGVTSLVMGIVFMNYEKENHTSKRHFTPLLTYDYELEKDGIKYLYWDVNGERRGDIKMNINNWDVYGLKVLENQVFYKGKQLTFDHGSKKKVMKVDDQILFLSDYGRGLGFYGLHKIRLNEE